MTALTFLNHLNFLLCPGTLLQNPLARGNNMWFIETMQGLIEIMSFDFTLCLLFNKLGLVISSGSITRVNKAYLKRSFSVDQVLPNDI